MLEHTVKDEIATKIDDAIKSKIYEQFISAGMIEEMQEWALLVVKYKLDIAYSLSKGTYGYDITVIFACRCGIINFSESLWSKYGGLYDFTKIKYISYKDLFHISNKGKRMAPLLDYASQDDTSGSFFIPVSNAEKYYPRDLQKNGFSRATIASTIFIKVTGVRMNNRKGRLTYQRIDQKDNGIIKIHDKITRVKLLGGKK